MYIVPIESMLDDNLIYVSLNMSAIAYPFAASSKKKYMRPSRTRKVMKSVKSVTMAILTALDIGPH
jgi:hypothetical protein